jgi:hypothetical protein
LKNEWGEFRKKAVKIQLENRDQPWKFLDGEAELSRQKEIFELAAEIG